MSAFSSDKRITILVGEFGSGKTELAIARALQLSAEGIKTAIVDIDIVKPYFRTRENRKLLEDNGVFVVAPDSRLADSDLPIMPHDLTRVLYDSSYHVVMDAGGGESAIALGQLRPHLEENGYNAVMIVNTRRPFTADSNGIKKALRRIEQVSRLKITGLLANTNLSSQTTAQDISEGLVIVKEAADHLNLPLCGVVAPVWLQGEVTSEFPVFWLKLTTRYPWME